MTETYFVFNDKSSLDFNLAVRERASYTAAERNVEYIDVAGRNGSLLRDKGTFKNVEEPISCYLFANDREVKNIRAEANSVFNWLKSPPGWRKLFYSDDEHYFMKAHVPQSLSFNEVFYLFFVGEGEINFTRKPERWSIAGQNTLTITESGGTIYNPELYPSFPRIKIFGTGNITLYINNKTVILKEVEESIILDSEMQNSYIDRDGFILPANNQVQNTLPTLAVGANTFEWAGNVDKIEVIPRWWTL
ncbi:hypothetical protein HCV63_001908 [Listeria monocytogenes]|uniref:Phage tail protein n=1 Tax=Listeria monocytogenes TaxID=1639 RepID=A0A9P2DHV8_LISMN|nr:hypothetical protein [Listeria monocytogenes]AVV07547.1 hypothetical protein CXL08_11410 [Listeria monocytogenes]EAA0328919.1 hypothetical protein [Listeria monocytogenes]EAC2927773.1 hypothetical protein [Listeria monocytogenes]EAC2933883.1 hypothetical protein [Listeria monocytogenes]EAC3540311.1 hypothetical protein [Listeria monocytogenes]